jgi:tRNA threonylcarbamoyladenosine biosynthesis protein TsaE
VEETRALGRAIGATLSPGDVVALSGDLGAGKTAFVQGAVGALGAAGPVVSPTFTLVREYEGTVRVVHMDVYRLDRVQDVLDLGFDEYVDGGAVVFIEWGDVIQGLLPESWLGVRLSMDDEDEDRRAVDVTGTGPAWDARWDVVRRSVAPWGG